MIRTLRSGLPVLLLVSALALLLLPLVGAAQAQPAQAQPAQPMGQVAGQGELVPPPPTEPVQPFRPSGFWTSSRPAQGGAYRYRLLGVGVGVAAITGMITVWVVRRQARRSV